MLPVKHLAREGLCAKLRNIGGFTSQRIQEAPKFVLARPGTGLGVESIAPLKIIAHAPCRLTPLH
jgi:hypothetical protein